MSSRHRSFTWHAVDAGMCYDPLLGEGNAFREENEYDDPNGET